MSTRILADDPPDIRSLKRQVRILLLLDAAEHAGLSPLPARHLHTLAYLANVLAPVWELSPLEEQVYKNRGGPYYPSLQRDVDRLVGLGMVVPSHLDNTEDGAQCWRIVAHYRLNRALAADALHAIEDTRWEEQCAPFLRELAYALSALADHAIDAASGEDALYADPIVSYENVIDFEDKRRNSSANAAQQFEHLLPGDSRATPGEMLHLYVDHIQRRLGRGD